MARPDLSTGTGQRDVSAETLSAHRRQPGHGLPHATHPARCHTTRVMGVPNDPVDATPWDLDDPPAGRPAGQSPRRDPVPGEG